MHNVLPERLPYNPNQFVNRKKALRQVLETVRLLAAGLPVERRVFFVCGERGCGKTWFQHHLAWELERQEMASVLYLNLPDRWEEERGLIRLTVESIAASVQKANNPSLPSVLLIDGVDDVPADLVERLEEHVLAPAAQQPRTLIVIAERSGPRHWNGPEFREKSTRIELGPYEDPAHDYVRAQIEKQLPATTADLDEVREWSGGYPWSAYLLARNLPLGGRALQNCALSLLGEHQDLYPYLEALSVLRAFDEVRMSELFGLCFPDETWDYPACLDMRKKLLATTMVHWVKEKRGYVIDEPLRLLLEAALRQRERALWRGLHCVAYRLYEEWVGNFEQSREEWAREQAYHEEALRRDGYQAADCPPRRETPEEGGEA